MEALAHPPHRQRRKEARPAELIAAALELFVEKGFTGTRLEDVAARAGVSKGTLYLDLALCGLALPLASDKRRSAK